MIRRSPFVPVALVFLISVCLIALLHPEADPLPLEYELEPVLYNDDQNIPPARPPPQGNLPQEDVAAPNLLDPKAVALSAALSAAKPVEGWSKVPAYMPEIPPHIHQTWRSKNLDGDQDLLSKTNTWRNLNPGYDYTLYDDAEADTFMRENFPAPIYEAYSLMPKPVLKADFFRYAVLLIRGGVYSDVDTGCLRPISSWIEGYPDVGLIVGIEADPNDRPNWDKWYARHLQLVQWTIAGAPGHPTLKRAVEKIVEQSAERRREGEENGGKYNIMDWTGPGLWTDVVWEYVQDTYGLAYTDFQGLESPKQVDDVLVLPITGFSPDVGHMGSKSSSDPEAKVKHYFKGSWKGV